MARESYGVAIRWPRKVLVLKIWIRIFLVLMVGELIWAKVPSKQTIAPKRSFSQNHSLTLAYSSQLRQDSGEAPIKQTTDVGLSSNFEFTQFKFTSYLYYSHSLTSAPDSDVDDPLFTLTTLPQNVVPALSLRYYVLGTVGASQTARHIQKQIGTLGVGFGAKLNTDYLRIPYFNLNGTFTISKAFQESEVNSKGESNDNYYTQYGVTGSYSYGRWTGTVFFMLYQYFKYVSDGSSEVVLQFQELSYQITKSQGVAIGHANRMGLFDENSGEANFKIFDDSSSIGYASYTYSF